MSSIVNLSRPGQAPTEGDLVEIDGKVKKTYHEKAPLDPYDTTNMTLEVSLSAGIVALGGSVTVTANIKLMDDTLAPITATYRVPVMGIDGVQNDLLTVDFVNGTASFPYTPSKVGIYTIDLTKVRPVPGAQLSESPEIVVTQ